MILLWGLPSDEPLRMVEEALLRARAPVAFLDQRAVLDTEIELTIGAHIGGCLRVGDQRIDLAAVTAIYLRPYETRRMPAVAQAGGGSVEEGYAASVEDVLVSWVETAPALVLNRPTAMATNTSKPYQVALIREDGFAVPDTLVTSDREAVLDFRDKHGAIIYKSISGARSIVSRLGCEQMARLEDLRWCPTQFQQYVAGTDHRVHVVGEEVFACEILSAADDFRYAAQQGAVTEMRACELSEECAARCRNLAARLGLSFAGIDLRLSPAGEWYCFEVNPCPGFSYFQNATGQRIDEAVACLLMAGPRASTPPT